MIHYISLQLYKDIFMNHEPAVRLFQPTIHNTISISPNLSGFNFHETTEPY